VIVVDTSVWVAAKRDVRTAAVLDSVLEADELALALPVRLDTWRQMTDAIALAADAGARVVFVDVLIGVLANDAGAPVW
jgi:hypothetical protein